jgi:hypothetical protein
MLRHQLNPNGPFESYNGSDPVTKKFHYVGPFKFQFFSEVHRIDVHVNSDPDVFLIDCEGLHSLEKTTTVLQQATFALSQIVSMITLVMKEQVNYENIEHVRSLFVLSHAFTRQLPGFSIGTTIMMQEVGVSDPKGQRLSLDEKNALRQQSDHRQRQLILDVLNRARLNFSERDLLDHAVLHIVNLFHSLLHSPFTILQLLPSTVSQLLVL